ncbi:YBR284W [Saccharomyces arboricola H-6]|uniref:YBR284W n=1 Tax=Saccharomyces arboricola (strain H-6 / AS 2.3317 / CBS 10644) TaxID=1160507 RepID=J8QAW2_SACAR|nr:YBR284W [Saccharomyces arboricola H-6]
MTQDSRSLSLVGYDSYKESPSASPILLDGLDGNDDTPDQGLGFDSSLEITSQQPERNSRAFKLEDSSADGISHLDDLDMIPLTTKFDTQMKMGSPMAMPPETLPPVKPITATDLVYSSLAHLPSYFFEQTHFRIERKCLLEMCKLRRNYLIVSKQDALSCFHLHPKLPEQGLKPVEDRLSRMPHLLNLREDKTSTSAENNDYKRELYNGAVDVPTFKEFRQNFERCLEIIRDKNLSRFSEKRLQYLLNKFPVFQYLHSKEELKQSKKVPHKDFYNCRKIDLNLLLSSCFSQWQLNEFIWAKLRKEPNRIIYQTTDGKHITLSQLFKVDFEETNMFCNGLKIINDSFLEWYKVIYLAKYHLINSEPETYIELHDRQFRYYLIAKTFLEFDNYTNGEYLAELLQEFLIKPQESSKYQLCQLSVDFQFYLHYGDSNVDNWWMVFSNWLNHYNLFSDNICWNIRISRIYPKLYQTGKVKNFQDFLNLIFSPLFNAQSCSHKSLGPILSKFLSRIASFDLCIQDSDDYIWKQFTEVNCLPQNWTSNGDNPTISQYMYYVYANLAKLNHVRRVLHQTTFTLRSSCSPTSMNRTSQFSSTRNFTEHTEAILNNFLLASGGFLNAENLWYAPPSLIYVFYLSQIPMVVAPLNSIADPKGTTTLEDQAATGIVLEPPKHYSKNPFMKFFEMGFKISLSSESILYNHSYTREPIIEEYSVAASIYRLPSADLCELLRNSVITSGFASTLKVIWLGISLTPHDYFMENTGFVNNWYDCKPNTSLDHNVPIIRRQYRNSTLSGEWRLIIA